MEKHLKTQFFSKLLNSSFTSSCRKKSISDVTNQPENPENNPRLIDLFSPKPQPCIPPPTKPKNHLSRQKTPHFHPKTTSNSVSPVHEKRAKTERKKKTNIRKRPKSMSFSSVTDNTYYNWWTSDEDEKQSSNTLFSRRSVSSFSGEGDRRLMDGVVVTKESSDPHEDFRVSMVDMIVEKGIFGVEELENLVECFVKLNSEEHHKVIFEVFAEIWESLVSDK